MKKSEMLEILHNSLVSNFIPYYNIEFNPKIEKLLDDLGKAGMLPPKFLDKEENTFMSADQVIDCGNLYGEFEWEPEDE